MLLCSCVSQDSQRPPLPNEIDLNRGAGQGDMLLVTLRLQDGEKLLFGMDTGAPVTLLDLKQASLKNRMAGMGFSGGFGTGFCLM